MRQDDDGVGWVQTVQYAAWCYLDNFSSSVCHGQRTRVETRGGREDVQLAHLVDATATHTHDFSFRTINPVRNCCTELKYELNWKTMKHLHSPNILS